MRQITRQISVGVAVALLAVGLTASPAAALTTTRAELSGGDLRVEGQDAVANAPISIDGVIFDNADGKGKFRVEITGFVSATCVIAVSDGSDTELVTLGGCTPSGGNQAPTANAGADQTVIDADGSGAEVVSLDGSGSTDPEGAIASYSWVEAGVTLGSGAAISPTFAVGSHTITLTVTDGDGATDSDPVVITVEAAPPPPPGNQSPTANAGIDQTVVDADANGTELVTLDGSASTDDGTIVSYEWSENGVPISGTTGGSAPLPPTPNLVVSGNADFMVEGNQADPEGFIPPNFGAYSDSAGDVNGDGFDDIIVVAPNWDNGTPNGGATTDEFAEGAAFIFLGSANGIVGTNPATAHAQIETNQFGARITAGKGIGDVNGDGFDDIAIGSPFYESLYFGQPLEVNGAVFVYYGGPSGITGTDPSNADVSLFSTQLGGSFGGWIDGAGDVNGDGFDDLLVSYAYGTPFPLGIPLNQRSGGAGAALIYHGGPTGLTAPTGVGIDDADSVILAFEDTGAPQPTVYGTIRTVAGVGDVNGDGFDDIILGGQDANLFLGSATGIVGANLSQARSTVSPNSLGVELQVAAAGDVNGDGFSDVILADPRLELEPFTAEQQGAAYVALGGSTGLGITSVDQAHASFFGSMNPENLGFSNDGVGDVDNDGFDDIVISALIYPGSLDWEGVGYLFRGSATGITAATVLDADTRLESIQSGVTVNGQLRGLSVSGAGDVNGDGLADILIGKGFWTSGQPREGAAFVYLGESFPPNPNTPPVANAGIDQVYTDTDQSGFETVTVDGNASFDPDGTIISYEWYEGETLLGSGAVASVSLSTTGDHTLALVVTDDQGVRRGDVATVRVELAPSVLEFFDGFNTLGNWTSTGDVTLGSAGVFPDAPTVRMTGNSSLRGSFPVAGGSTGLDISFNARGDTFAAGDRIVVRASFDGGPFTEYFVVGTADVDGTFTFYGGSSIPISLSWWPSTASNVVLEFATEMSTGVAWIDDLVVRSLQAPTGGTVPPPPDVGSPTIQTSLSVGTHTVTLTVTDDQGATGTDTVVVTVDAPGVNQPPTANPGPDQSSGDGDGNATEAFNLDGSSSSDADGIVVSYVWTEGGQVLGSAATVSVVLGIGSHTITLTVTDDQGATASATTLLTVIANLVPTAVAGADQTAVDTDNTGSELITIDGSGSIDTDGNIAGFEWSENGIILGSTAVLAMDFAVGSHALSLTVTDNGGATATDQVSVTVDPPAPPPPPPPPTGGGDIVYVSSTSGGTVGGVSFADEDILMFDTTTGTWAMYLDGSDVGLGGSGRRDIDAFHILDDGSVLLSIVGASTIPDVGDIDDSDIVRFIPTSLGANTAGSFEWYFDGSDVGLTAGAEDVDAIMILADGDLLLSTSGTPAVPGLSGLSDEDLIRFNPTSLGAATRGTWSTYFDGSDVSLNTSSSEDTHGAWVDPNGDIFITARGTFAVAGVSGTGSDVFTCSNPTVGDSTSCGSFSLFFDGTANAFGSETTDGIHIIHK